MNHTFYLVDVFAESKYAGNQLAVIRNADGLSTEEMQAIAREMHFSETTFIPTDRPNRDGYDVRIFTPETELPFAGHPTLGTAFIIREQIIHAPVGEVRLNLKVGQIPVTFKGDLIWMRQVPPTFGEAAEPVEVGASLRLPPSAVDSRFPVQLVSTGIPFLIVPLTKLKWVEQAQPDWQLFDERTHRQFPKAVLVFAAETLYQENQLHVRVFVDEVGVPEDPATGSANGCLAGYLVRHSYFGRSEIDVRVEQGYEVKRPSLLLLRAGEQDGTIQVNVEGRARLVARGELV